MDILIDKISIAYEKRANKSGAERDALLKTKAKLMRTMDNLYKPIEKGTADDFDRQRLNDVKAKVNRD